MIPTILSRCQIYDFNRIGVTDIAEHLQYVAEQEGITAEPSALGVIARKADGAMRDALSIFDQVAASCSGNITYQGTIANLNVLDYEYWFRLTDAFLKGDVPQALLIYKEVRDAGFDSLQFINGLAAHLRDLMVAAVPQTLPLLEVSADVAERYQAQAKQINPKWAYAAMEQVNYCDVNYRTTANKQFLVELTLIRLCQLINPNEAGAGTIPGQPAPLKQPAPAHNAQSPAQPAAQPASATRPQTAPATSNAATPRPGVAPQPAAPRPAQRTMTPPITPVAGGGARPKAFRINAGPQRPQPAAAPQAPATEDTPQVAGGQIDMARLTEAWNRFPTLHPELHLLVTIMRGQVPQLGAEPGMVTVPVSNPGQQQTVEEGNNVLVPYLREATGCQGLRVVPVIVEQGERQVVLTDRELYEKSLADSPELASVLTSLDLSFAD